MMQSSCSEHSKYTPIYITQIFGSRAKCIGQHLEYWNTVPLGSGMFLILGFIYVFCSALYVFSKTPKLYQKFVHQGDIIFKITNNIMISFFVIFDVATICCSFYSVLWWLEIIPKFLIQFFIFFSLFQIYVEQIDIRTLTTTSQSCWCGIILPYIIIAKLSDSSITNPICQYLQS